MHRFTLGLALVLTLVGGVARGSEPTQEAAATPVAAEQQEQAVEETSEEAAPAEEAAVEKVFRARFGDDKKEGTARIYLYTAQDVNRVEMLQASSKKWLRINPATHAELKAFGTNGYFSTAKDTVYSVRAVLPDGTRIYEGLYPQEDGSILVKPYATETKEDVAKADAAEEAARVAAYKAWMASRIPPIGGASWATPQQVAQARANYMAQIGQMGHHGGGAVITNVGTLYEGVGMTSGGGIPNTCAAADGRAPLGDATAYGRGGTYRCRLYNCGTVSPGGGRGRGRRR